MDETTDAGNKMDPEIKDRWVARLRSGEITQGRSTLSLRDKYCCLGVLCEMAAEDGVTARATGEYGTVLYDGYTTSLPLSVRHWAKFPESRTLTPPMPVAGLYDDNHRLSAENLLVELNDTARQSFEQIADWVEENL